KEEQRQRFLRRIDLPDHNWKFSAADVREREYFDDYRKAMSETLSHTSTEWAPWYVIPADRKWFMRIGAAAVLAHTLMEIDPRYPAVSDERRQQLHEVKAGLEAEAPEGAAPEGRERRRPRGEGPGGKRGVRLRPWPRPSRELQAPRVRPTAGTRSPG